MKRSKQSSEFRIPDLPKEIWIDILSRLPIKAIVACRCVSQTWCNLLSYPEFTKLHLDRSHVQVIVQNRVGDKVSFHILEHDDDDKPIKPFLSRFRLSMCNFVAVNSCNGFLLLAAFEYHYNPVKVCNPITGEYLNLPRQKMDNLIDSTVVSGFGFSANTNQYKVVRLVHRELDPDTEDWMVEVYTIGTKSWRSIGTAPKSADRLSSATFFNGAIHWICYAIDSSDYVFSFDFESEKFGIVPLPPHFSTEPIMNRLLINIGVIGEFFYASYNMELWMMKEYGVEESWTKVYVVENLPAGSYQAIKYLSGGKILMNYRDNKDQSYCDKKLISYDPVGKFSKEPNAPQFYCFKTFAHAPSFMSFNDAMMGDKAAKLQTRMCGAQCKGKAQVKGSN